MENKQPTASIEYAQLKDLHACIFSDLLDDDESLAIETELRLEALWSAYYALRSQQMPTEVDEEHRMLNRDHLRALAKLRQLKKQFADKAIASTNSHVGVVTAARALTTTAPSTQSVSLSNLPHAVAIGSSMSIVHVSQASHAVHQVNAGSNVIAPSYSKPIDSDQPTTPSKRRKEHVTDAIDVDDRELQSWAEQVAQQQTDNERSLPSTPEPRMNGNSSATAAGTLASAVTVVDAVAQQAFNAQVAAENRWCRVCHSHHHIEECQQFINATIAMRKRRAQTEKRCVVCLDTSHAAASCQKSGCECGLTPTHHALLCNRSRLVYVPLPPHAVPQLPRQTIHFTSVFEYSVHGFVRYIAQWRLMSQALYAEFHHRSTEYNHGPITKADELRMQTEIASIFFQSENQLDSVRKGRPDRQQRIELISSLLFGRRVLISRNEDLGLMRATTECLVQKSAYRCGCNMTTVTAKNLLLFHVAIRNILEIPSLVMVNWNAREDVFVFEPPNDSQTDEPRRVYIKSAVENMCSIPGLLEPMVTHARLIAMAANAASSTVQNSAPDDWEIFCSELDTLTSIRLQRHFGNTEGEPIVLHVFCASSKHTISAVVYVTVGAVSNRVATLVTASSERVPNSTAELTADLRSAHLAHSTFENVRAIYGDRLITVRRWTSSPRLACESGLRDHFGCHHDAEQAELLLTGEKGDKQHTWEIVDSQDNPALLAAVGLNPAKLSDSSLWWHGPHWLTLHSENWPSIAIPPIEAFAETQPFAECIGFVSPNLFKIINKTSNNEDWGYLFMVVCRRTRACSVHPVCGTSFRALEQACNQLQQRDNRIKVVEWDSATLTRMNACVRRAVNHIESNDAWNGIMFVFRSELLELVDEIVMAQQTLFSNFKTTFGHAMLTLDEFTSMAFVCQQFFNSRPVLAIDPVSHKPFVTTPAARAQITPQPFVELQLSPLLVSDSKEVWRHWQVEYFDACFNRYKYTPKMRDFVQCQSDESAVNEWITGRIIKITSEVNQPGTPIKIEVSTSNGIITVKPKNIIPLRK